MREERSLRDELETLQVQARTLRDELTAGASPDFLARRAQLTKDVERRTAVLGPLEAHAETLEAEVRALEARASKLRSEHARVEQQRLPPALVLVPLGVAVLLVPVLAQANQAGAWFLGGVAAALAGLVLGRAYAQPASLEAPLVPSLGRNVFFNPAAWSFVVLLPPLFVAAVSLELQPLVRWADATPLVTLFFEALAAAVTSVAVALAARRVSTLTARVSLLLSMGLLFLFAVRGHLGLLSLSPSPALTEVGLRAALLAPIAGAGLLIARPLQVLRGALPGLVLIAGLASVVSSVALGSVRDPVQARHGGGLVEFLESERELHALADAEYRRHTDAVAADQRTPYLTPAERARLQETTGDAKRALDVAKGRLSNDLTRVLLALQLGLLALLVTWSTKTTTWARRGLAALPLVVLLAAMNLRNVW
ncbi:MAG: hypothetical protein ACOZQL_32945 [Myxococcota bacterium]